MSGNTTLTNTISGLTGVIPALSEVIQVQYQVVVEGADPGDPINNFVEISTTNPEDTVYQNT